MASYADLQPIDYFGADNAPSLRAVGWLESGDAFPVGKADARVFERLRELLIAPFTPYAFGGAHTCTLCACSPEARGIRNLFVPGEGCLYVCPELILHYMNAHHYVPPEEFSLAVLSCPNQDTAEFRTLIRANGGPALARYAG
jgi:hypothetical protein